MFQGKCQEVILGGRAFLSGTVGAEPSGNRLLLAFEASADFLLLFGSQTT